MPTDQDIMKRCELLKGKPYIFGYEVDLDDPFPEAADCSELVQWACHQEGVDPEMPDGAIYQYRHCRNHDALIPIPLAIKTAGALLFRISPAGNHVAVSKGDGTTIEARGKDYGIGNFSATKGRSWTAAALIPGVDYGGD